MKQAATVLRHLCELCIFCGVLYLLIQAIDGDAPSSSNARGPAAQAGQPSRAVEPITPETAFSPSQY